MGQEEHSERRNHTGSEAQPEHCPEGKEDPPDLRIVREKGHGTQSTLKAHAQG